MKKYLYIGIATSLIVILYLFNLGPLKASIEVNYDLRACSEEYPLFTTVKNNSFLPMKNYYFEVSAKIPGRSSIVREHSYGTGYAYKSDVIIPARSSISSCWPTDSSRKRKILNGYYAQILEKNHLEDRNLEWFVSQSDFTY